MPGAGPTGFNVLHVPDMPGGGRTRHLATIEGIHVQGPRMMEMKALLCSSQSFRPSCTAWFTAKATLSILHLSMARILKEVASVRCLLRTWNGRGKTFVEFRITTDESEWAWCG